MWISNSMEADWFLVFANVSPEKDTKYHCLCSESSSTRFCDCQERGQIGIRGSSTCELTFRFTIPGWTCTGAMDIIFPYLHERKQVISNSIGDFQGVQFQYAEARAELEAARLLRTRQLVG
eukprot:jgi/Galph1/1495/GphlegSOOS_G166.1